jgi:hypothetical protein
MVILVLLDLDRPARGLFYVGHDPMINLQQAIQERVTTEERIEP